MRRKLRSIALSFLLCLSLLLPGCAAPADPTAQTQQDGGAAESGLSVPGPSAAGGDTAGTEGTEETDGAAATTGDVPEYSGEAYVIINDNTPDFTEGELVTDSFEQYSNLDSLGRCGAAYACIGQNLMPQEEREDISSVYPSGWEQAEYDSVDGGYLYNRCHLIGYQLTAENDNERNLITGTRYMNVEGMLPFENMVADYVKETGNHVLYRVTPIFEGDNLLASGVEMEALSVEDAGEGIQFHVYCYNVQPGISIDYATGESREEESEGTGTGQGTEGTYILNTNTLKVKIFDLDCRSGDAVVL